MAELRAWEGGMATLYLTEPRSLVRKDGDTLLVHIPADEKRGAEKRQVRVPLIKVTQVVVYGDVTLTSPALAASQLGRPAVLQGFERHFLQRVSQFARVTFDPLLLFGGNGAAEEIGQIPFEPRGRMGVRRANRNAGGIQALLAG